MFIAILRRLLSSILVILGVVTTVFVIQRLVSDPVSPYVSSNMSSGDIEQLRHTLGYDQPWWDQFLTFLGRVLTGQLGTSRVYGMPVIDVVARAAPITFTIVILALVLSLVVGVALGILSAVYKGSWVDSTIMSWSMLGQALPAFWLAILLILIFSVSLRWLPAGGYGTVPQLVLPVLALSANSANQFARVVRSEMIEVLSQDYIRTAKAQGVGDFRIFIRHAFRSSLLPVVTVLGVQLSVLITSTVVIEQVFSVPGVGRLLFNSIMQNDYAVTQAIAIYAAIVVTLVNLVVDISYTWLDPRIKLGAQS
ncbi:MAG: ABC transporter permease [Nocardioides sp.]|uniref:ABC transporter permease n=1 Tax=Nocardioides sp. TaxID=35761 RepID=UPI0039E5D0BD